MFSKLFTLAACAAVAFPGAFAADDENIRAAFDVEAGVKAATGSVNNLAIRTAAVERAVSGVAQGLVTAEKSMRRVAPLTDAANSLGEQLGHPNCSRRTS